MYNEKSFHLKIYNNATVQGLYRKVNEYLKQDYKKVNNNPLKIIYQGRIMDPFKNLSYYTKDNFIAQIFI